MRYERIAETAAFKAGLARVKKGIESYRVALMCAEKNPAGGPGNQTYLEDGNLEDNRDTERRLMKMLKIPELTLFDRPEDLIERAYDEQGGHIAYIVKHEKREEM